MKKFLPVLVLMASLCGPLACQQSDNEENSASELGQKIGSADAIRPTLDATSLRPGPTLTQACNHDQAEPTLMSPPVATQVLMDLIEIRSMPILLATLNQAGYNFVDLNQFFESMTFGHFPGTYADAKLVHFFELYDPEFADKVAAVREAKDADATESEIWSAKNFATNRLVELLDIVYQDEVKGRENNIQFSIGTIDYNWDVGHNGILVSHSQCDH